MALKVSRALFLEPGAAVIVTLLLRRADNLTRSGAQGTGASATPNCWSWRVSGWGRETGSSWQKPYLGAPSTEGGWRGLQLLRAKDLAWPCHTSGQAVNWAGRSLTHLLSSELSSGPEPTAASGKNRSVHNPRTPCAQDPTPPRS